MKRLLLALVLVSVAAVVIVEELAVGAKAPGTEAIVDADAQLLALAADLAGPVVVSGDVVDAGTHPATAAAPQVPAGGVMAAPVAIPSLQLTA